MQEEAEPEGHPRPRRQARSTPTPGVLFPGDRNIRLDAPKAPPGVLRVKAGSRPARPVQKPVTAQPAVRGGQLPTPFAAAERFARPPGMRQPGAP